MRQSACNITSEEGILPFQKIAMDLITGLPTHNGKDAILTIVDHGCSREVVFLLSGIDPGPSTPPSYPCLCCIHSLPLAMTLPLPLTPSYIQPFLLLPSVSDLLPSSTLSFCAAAICLPIALFCPCAMLPPVSHLCLSDCSLFSPDQLLSYLYI